MIDTDPHPGSPHDRNGRGGSCSSCYEHAVERIRQQQTSDNLRGSVVHLESEKGKQMPRESEPKGMATCRNCGAPIEWRTWAKSGKPCPLDPEGTPIANGIKRLVSISGSVRFFEEQDSKLHREVRSCHFDTCPERSAVRW